MRALILAGGLGTRLRPLTHTRPKHLLPIANRPHIEHVLHLLRRHGIDEVVLTTSYMADAFDQTVSKAREEGLTLEVTHEVAPLGTAGAIRHAASSLGDETFVAFNGDVLTDVDLGRVLDFHVDRGAKATVLLTPVDDPSAYGVVPTDENGLVRGFIEKPPPGEAPTNLINAGVYVMEPEILKRIPEGTVWSSEHSLFPELVEAEELYAVGSDAYWMDIGTPQKYLQANMDAVEGRYESDLLPVSPEQRQAAIDAQPDVPHLWSFIAADRADVAPSARFASAVVGRGARIGEDASIFSSVLLPDVEVGRGATIRNSVLGESVSVGAGVVVENATLADGETVPSPGDDG